MIDTDKKEFAKAVQEVLKSYGKECGTFTLRMWWVALSKFELTTVFNALGEYCGHPDKCKFAPQAGDIVGMIEGNKSDKKDHATIVWSRVLDNVNRYASVAFDDPAIHYALQVAFGGNWIDVCNFNADDFAYQEKHRSFITAYANYKQDMSYQPYFVGIKEQENGTSEITYIGNQEQARLVHQGGSHGGLDKSTAQNMAINPAPLVAIQ